MLRNMRKKLDLIAKNLVRLPEPIFLVARFKILFTVSKITRKFKLEDADATNFSHDAFLSSNSRV